MRIRASVLMMDTFQGEALGNSVQMLDTFGSRLFAEACFDVFDGKGKVENDMGGNSDES